MRSAEEPNTRNILLSIRRHQALTDTKRSFQNPKKKNLSGQACSHIPRQSSPKRGLSCSSSPFHQNVRGYLTNVTLGRDSNKNFTQLFVLTFSLWHPSLCAVKAKCNGKICIKPSHTHHNSCFTKIIFSHQITHASPTHSKTMSKSFSQSLFPHFFQQKHTTDSEQRNSDSDSFRLFCNLSGTAISVKGKNFR